MSTRRVITIAVVTVVTSLLLFTACVAALSGGRSQPADEGGGSPQGLAVQPAYEPTQSPAVEESQVTAVRGGETANDDGLFILSEPLRYVQGTIGGDKYFCSLVTMDNQSQGVVKYNGMFDWDLQNPEGYMGTWAIFGSQVLIGSGELPPGGKVKGDVCFELPSAASGQYRLMFETFLGGPEMEWVHQVG